MSSFPAQERVESFLKSPRFRFLLQALLLLLSAFLLLTFVYAAERRMRFPFEVEWIESGMLISVLRIVHGQGIYVAPSLHYVPYLYAPLYFYLSAAMTRLIGVGHYPYAGMRLVSTLSTLASCGAIYALVKTETRRRLPAAAAAGLYVGCFALTAEFFDIGRVDALCVCLLLLALLAQRRGYPVIAALLWVCTIQTKQTMLPVAIFVLCAEWQRPRRMFTALGTYVVVAAASIALLNHATDGWYGFYIFHVAQGLPLLARQFFLFFPRSIVGPMAAAWLVILAALVLTRPRLQSTGVMFYLFVSVAMIGGVWYVNSHRGSTTNAMMPVYAWIAVMFGVALARLLDRSEQTAAPLLAVLALSAASCQMLSMVYNPGMYLPSKLEAAANSKFVAQLRSINGDVYVVDHAYDAQLAGKTTYAESQAMGAVLDAPPTPRTASLRAEYAAAQAEHRFAAVVADGDPEGVFMNFDSAYPLAIATELRQYGYLTSQASWFLLPCDAPAALLQGLHQPDTPIVSNTCASPALSAPPPESLPRQKW